MLPEDLFYAVVHAVTLLCDFVHLIAAAGVLHDTHPRVHLLHAVCLHPLPIHVGLHPAR